MGLLALALRSALLNYSHTCHSGSAIPLLSPGEPIGAGRVRQDARLPASGFLHVTGSTGASAMIVGVVLVNHDQPLPTVACLI